MRQGASLDCKWESIDLMAEGVRRGAEGDENGEGKWQAAGNGDTATLSCVVRARARCPVASGVSGMLESVGNAHSKASHDWGPKYPSYKLEKEGRATSR